MARRGLALREHILDSAKSAFLASGFERTSMDAIATHAATSKRSLYAHFPTKDDLFVAVVARIREQFAERLPSPSEYSTDPIEALTGYIARFRQLLRWSSVILTLRLGIAEAERLPEVAAGLDDALFGVAARQLDQYLASQWGDAVRDPAQMRDEVLARAAYPLLPNLLLGVEPLEGRLGETSDIPAPEVERARVVAVAVIKAHTAR